MPLSWNHDFTQKSTIAMWVVLFFVQQKMTQLVAALTKTVDPFVHVHAGIVCTDTPSNES